MGNSCNSYDNDPFDNRGLRDSPADADGGRSCASLILLSYYSVFIGTVLQFRELV